MILVSAIMPTKARQAWAAQAVDCFLSQTYPNKELIILDDPTDPSFPGGLYMPNRILRFVAGGTGSIAQKRNSACELSHGEIIMHFDSDDWSASERMADQVQRLEESGKQVTAYHSMLFKAEDTGQWWKYLGHRAIGTSLCYRKAFWQAHPFPEAGTARGYEPGVGEDIEFTKMAEQLRDIITTDANDLMYARIHRGNTSVKEIGGAQLGYQHVPTESVYHFMR